MLNSTCRQQQQHRSSNSNIAATAAALQHHCCNTAALQQHHRSTAAAALQQQQQHCRCWQCLHCLLCLHWMPGLPCLYCFFGLLLLYWLHLLPCLGSIARFICWAPLLFSQGGLLHRRPPPRIDFLMCSRALFPCLVLVMRGGVPGHLRLKVSFCFLRVFVSFGAMDASMSCVSFSCKHWPPFRNSQTPRAIFFFRKCFPWRVFSMKKKGGKFFSFGDPPVVCCERKVRAFFSEHKNAS